MKILITGVTGMLGTSLSRLFLARHHEVCGLSRGKTSRLPLQGETLLKVDITDEAAIDRAVQSARPDVVFHAAAISDVDFCETSPAEADRVNGEGTRIVAKATCTSGALFCYLSTDYVFDGENKAPYREEDVCNPINRYGKSKWAGEKQTRSLCPRHYIVRTSWLFGENRDSFVHHVLEWALSRKEIRLVGDKWANPTYAPDLAECLYRLIETRAPFGTYHITNQEGGCSWFDYGKQILAYRGMNGVAVTSMSLAKLKRPAKRPPMSVLNIDKFLEATGSPPRSWREALREYLSSVCPSQKP
ncbi:MAG: dTDP-4-dehydrorhamnose reductase [Candidatus Omnitrophica bacterium]|nr:dTDP-4-dehydrorhamnose reductase [Candidatus Omnitrophota bacterium]